MYVMFTQYRKPTQPFAPNRSSEGLEAICIQFIHISHESLHRIAKVPDT
jgi:hypothetical protein